MTELEKDINARMFREAKKRRYLLLAGEAPFYFRYIR
jgi:hypothetical protein